MKKSKNRGKKKIQELFVIDEEKNLVFDSENKIFDFFDKPIHSIEKKYLDLRKEDDFSDEEQTRLEKYLDLTLAEPDEIWFSDTYFTKAPIHIFIKNFVVDKLVFDYVAIVFLSTKERNPTFVLSHFPSKHKELVNEFKFGAQIFSHEMEIKHFAGLEGDALSEDDSLAIGLCHSMMRIRSEKDIPLSDFGKFIEMREDTIQNPDEIWRTTDHLGNVLVYFIKENPDSENGCSFYVAITLEEESPNENSVIHTLLFSFPSNDENLIDRYRQGENLQAEDVSQESSH